MNTPMNAIETWPLYDAVLIGQNMSQKSGAAWFDSFAAIADETEIGFFNARNRSLVGAPYNNMDTSEQVAFPFLVDSIGLECSVPFANDIDPSNNNSLGIPRYQMFQELMRHCNFRLVISQDEKLNCSALSVPGGVGVSGFVAQTDNGTPQQWGISYSGMGNGDPTKQMRFPFPEPIRIPRNRNISAFLQFSQYARIQLRSMGGPGRIRINPAFLDPATQLPTFNSTTVPGVVIMRVFLHGCREVQQRNALHF